MAKLKRGRSTDENNDDAEEQSSNVSRVNRAKKLKGSKISSSGSGNTNEKGEPYWQLASSTRRVTISKFGYGKSKEVVRIDIREFYEKDGEHLPGKKGISLSVEQYNALLRVLPSINTALAKEEETVEGNGLEQMEMDVVKEMPASEPQKGELKRAKSNIEATSDEDEDEDEE